jgi:hypothetical protein
MQQNMARFGTPYRWTRVQRTRSRNPGSVDYNEISRRFLENGALHLCESCLHICKIPAPNIPVRFTCYDYIQAGGDPIPKPSKKIAGPRPGMATPLPPYLNK